MACVMSGGPGVGQKICKVCQRPASAVRVFFLIVCMGRAAKSLNLRARPS